MPVVGATAFLALDSDSPGNTADGRTRHQAMPIGQVDDEAWFFDYRTRPSNAYVASMKGTAATHQGALRLMMSGVRLAQGVAVVSAALGSHQDQAL